MSRILSVASQQVPLLNHNDCLRVEMACNQMRQSICLVNPDVPLVKSGAEAAYTSYSSSVVHAKQDGKRIKIEDNEIELWFKDDKKNEHMIVKYVDDTIDIIDIGFKSYLGFDKTVYPNVKENQTFKQGDIIASTRNINNKTGELMLGRNALVGFLSMRSWNYEDAIVISESCAKQFAYKHTHHGRLELDDDVLFDITNNNIDNKTYKPMPENGTYVEKGDTLFKRSQLASDNISALIPCTENITAPCSGYFYAVVKARRESVNHSGMSKWLKNDVLKNQNKYERKLKEIFEQHNDSEFHTHRYCYHKNKKNIKAKTVTIDYYIIEEKDLFVGCKLANRHGNKGVISKILPDDMMPKLDDGTPLDIVLNPLGVISRMNTGQLFEVHLTWAMCNYLNKYAELPDDDFLLKCNEFIQSIDNTPCKDYSQQCLAFTEQHPEVAKDIRENGLQMVQPPFHGCTAQQVTKALDMAGVDFETNVTLHDGTRTEASVGFMYMLRLEHEPDHKIFGRSVGVYGKHEQAPAGTDAHRFGEMEVWCLLSNGAYDTIREYMSIKADNPSERTKFMHVLYNRMEEYYKPISYETTTMETFKTYLRGCGLRVNFNA